MIIDRIAAAAILAGSLAACASARRLGSAPPLAKAKATVSFEKSADHGTRIVLKVKGLPEPEGLNPPGYAYVAWVQSDREATAQNVGALLVDDERRGELRTETPLRDFELFVTVETAGDAAKPAGPPLLWTHRDARVTHAGGDDWAQLALGATP